MAKRVLLIDYESHSVERVRGVLREPDYEVVAAHDGEEALATFSGSRFDIVLLSGMLPRLPSAEVIREIRRRGGPTAPPILLMVSGYKGTNPKADAQRVGAFDLLPRPFSDETLREATIGAVSATAATARGAEQPAQGEASLTASDIFSDILEEVTRETAPQPPPPRPTSATDDEVERRLRDTLSGVLPKMAPSARPTPKSSTQADVERLLTQTLSGLRTESRPRSTAPSAAPPAPAPPPAAPAPSVSEAPAPSPDRFGQYEILERVSSGGMAELFRARLSGAEGFRKIVAIKKILPHIAGDEEFLAMFADEAKLAAQLSHPNIVHIFDLGKIESGGYFIAMEYVDGRDLRSILYLARENGIPMPVPLAVSIAAKVASALDYAHRKRGDDGSELRIVHRDVSPANILVSSDGDVKLCDFGIAKAESKVSRTETGALKGKLPYMSPEQAWGQALDHRSDIYSLGAVLFEMLAGRQLFTGDSEVGILEKVRAGEVTAPSKVQSEVPPALDTIVLKALSREPDGRYPAASDMLRELEAVLRSYEPAPSSGELAVYVRHLEAEDGARKEARARDAALPPPALEAAPEPAPLPKPPPSVAEAPRSKAAAAAAKPERPRKEKRAARRPEPAAPPAAAPPPPAPKPVPAAALPPPVIFASSLAPASDAAEGKKRTTLY
ncbi:MAG TPA: protein kinase, partial [Thermoanaerobaculia bacterium]|nr:protein kinase [Thermoanaerobaculia bacterium]